MFCISLIFIYFCLHIGRTPVSTSLWFIGGRDRLQVGEKDLCYSICMLVSVYCQGTLTGALPQYMFSYRVGVCVCVCVYFASKQCFPAPRTGSATLATRGKIQEVQNRVPRIPACPYSSDGATARTREREREREREQ